MTFLISLRWCCIIHLKCEYCVRRELFHELLLLLRHVVPLNDGNCRLTMPVVKGRCACEYYLTLLVSMCLKPLKGILPQQNIFTMNLRTSLTIVILLLTPMIGGINQKTVPMIGMESMVIRAPLRYTRDCLPSGICSLIKPAAMANLISFPSKGITVMLYLTFDLENL